FLTKLSGEGCSTLSIKRRINKLKQMNVYPIRSYIGTANSFKYQLLNFVINHERILYPLTRMNYLIKKLSPRR
ncbi:MAG: hypothetical protein WBM43_15065, partial [Flavobacteriaceae bacterium]